MSPRCIAHCSPREGSWVWEGSARTWLQALLPRVVMAWENTRGTQFSSPGSLRMSPAGNTEKPSPGALLWPWAASEGPG